MDVTSINFINAFYHYFKMENKKLGTLFLIFSLIFLGFLIYFNGVLYDQSDALNCNPSEECKQVESTISYTHIGFGFFGFMFGLGFYLLFFNKTDERIFKRLEDHKNEKINDEKFNIILKALDPYEQKVLKAIKEQDGITQNTLKLRTDMSKAKLSYVLQDLEKKNLISRKTKGKTLEVWLKV